MWCSAVAQGDPLGCQQMVGVHLTIRKSALTPWVACAGCQSTASTFTGPQTPEDSLPTCPFITWATSCLGNLRSLCACQDEFLFSVFTCTAVLIRWGSLPSTSVWPVITSDAQILTLQTKQASETIATNTVLPHSCTIRRTNKAASPLST